MLKENQKAICKWNSRNKQYYVDKGYQYTKMGEEFEVDIDDLTPSSKANVVVVCDYCGKEVIKTYQCYLKQHHVNFGDACNNCQPQKNKLICMDKYGVDNGSKTPEAIQKIKDTCMDRYGVDNGSKTPEARQKIKEALSINTETRTQHIKEAIFDKYGVECVFNHPDIQAKIKQAMIDKYGVEYPKQSAIIKERERQHNLKKYNVEHVMQLPEVKAKAMATCMKHYGVPYSLQSEEVRAKGAQTLYKHGKVSTSKAQLQVYNLLNYLYGNCELNYPCGRCFLDCMININDARVDIEYDGWYWHKDRQEQDRKRDEFVKSQGYKILRIKANNEVPVEEQLIQAIDYLVKGNHSYTEIILDI